MSTTELQERRIRYGKQKTKLKSSTAQWVSHNYHELEPLPEPGKEWTSNEPGFEHYLITKLQLEGLIEQTSREGKDRYYRTKPSAYEAVQKFVKQSAESDRLLPCDDKSCPGKGFVTTSEGLECKGCGEVHDKEDVR